MSSLDYRLERLLKAAALAPRETVAGLGADLTPLPGLALDLQAERRHPAAPTPDSMRYIGFLRWTFLKSDIFSVRFQRLDYLASSRQRVDSVYAAYSREFDVPIGRRADLGALEGAVYDAELPARPGLTWLAMVPLIGTVAQIPLGGITVLTGLNPVPVKVAIEGGKTQRLDLGVTREAAVDLQLALFEAEGGAPLVTEEGRHPKLAAAGGAGGVWIELKRGEESVAHPTDGDGRLKVRNLRPGRWTARIDVSGLPEKHYAEKETFELDLAPGQTRAVVIKVLPRLRKLILLEEK